MRQIAGTAGIIWLILSFPLSEGLAQQPPCADKTENPVVMPDCVNAIVTNYIEIKDALVNSNQKQAAREASELVTFLNEINIQSLKARALQQWMDKKNEIVNLAERLSELPQIAEQRAVFSELTGKMRELVEEFGPIYQALYRQFCPKALGGAGAYWLNEKKEILNPYGGEKNLHCGETVEVIRKRGN